MYDAGAIILAGGGSSRMGCNKSLLPYRGIPLIAHIARQLEPHFGELMIGANTPAEYAFLGLPAVADQVPGQGPLMGLVSCLEAASHDWNLVVATDIPELPLALLPRMFAQTAAHRCVVPRTPDGRFQPLFGLYHRTLTAEMWSLLERGERRMQALLDQLAPATVPVDEHALRNLNTSAEYRAALGQCPPEADLDSA